MNQEEGLPPHTESAGTLISDSTASTTVRKTFLLFIKHPVLAVFVIAAQKDQDTFLHPLRLGKRREPLAFD